MKVHDTNINYYALILCMFNKDYTPSKAFKVISEGQICIKDMITDEDIENMIKLKERKTYKYIGELYGLTPKAVFQRIKKYKNRKEQSSTFNIKQEVAC